MVDTTWPPDKSTVTVFLEYECVGSSPAPSTTAWPLRGSGFFLFHLKS